MDKLELISDYYWFSQMNVTLVKEALDNYYWGLADPRVENWLLMSSPIPTLILVILYLLGILFLGPKLMKNHKPFNLKNIIIVYNAFQVLFSFFMFTEHLLSGWLHYSYKCQPVDYSYNYRALRMANLCWWYYISKFTEFMDTIFFVLRKKHNQISLLHLYHHSLTPIETWICVRFVPGGHGTFSNIVNNAVHVIMYSYYLLAGMGPTFTKYLWWKKHLTTLQLVQFTLVFIHSAQALFLYDCNYPKIVLMFLLVHSTIFFILFLDFFVQNYYNKKSFLPNCLTCLPSKILQSKLD